VKVGRGATTVALLGYRKNRGSLRALACAAEAAAESGGEPPEILFLRKSADLDELDPKPPPVFLISAMSTQHEEVAGAVDALKRRFPGAYVAAGGPHAAALPETMLEVGADAVCLGEGEEQTFAFLQALGRGASPAQAATLAGFRTTDTEGERPAPTTLEAWPAVSVRFSAFGPIEITRGCPNRCLFCQTPRLFGPVRHRPLESVLAAAAEMLSRGMRDVRCLAPNALAYGSRDAREPNTNALETLLSSLRRLVERRNGRLFFGTFPSEVRPEFVRADTLRILARHVHNRRLVIGVQSGSDETLRRLRRGHTATEAFEAVRLALEAGFRVEADFIFGFPEELEPPEALAESVSFAERVAELGARIHAHWFMPLPGTPLAGVAPLEPPQKLHERLLRLLGRAGSGQWERQRRSTRALLRLARRRRDRPERSTTEKY